MGGNRIRHKTPDGQEHRGRTDDGQDDDRQGGKPRQAMEQFLKALEMGRRYNKLWSLLQKLSQVNWEIVKLENE